MYVPSLWNVCWRILPLGQIRRLGRPAAGCLGRLVHTLGDDPIVERWATREPPGKGAATTQRLRQPRVAGLLQLCAA